MTLEDFAREMHDAYERLAPLYGYETRQESRLPWKKLPARHRELMMAACAYALAVSRLEGPAR